MYSNTFETDVFVFIFMEMKSIHIRILLKVFAPGLAITSEEPHPKCENFNTLSQFYPTDLTFDLAIVTLTYKMLSWLYLGNPKV